MTTRRGQLLTWRSGRRAMALATVVLVGLGGLVGIRTGGMFTEAAAASSLAFAPPVDIDGSNTLNDVSCPSTSLCVAVDGAGNVVTTADPGGGAGAWTVTSVDTAALYGVSCPSTTLCVAADTNGSVLTSTNPTSGAAAWTKTTVAAGASLVAVSCPSVSLCVVAAQVSAGAAVFVSTNPTGGPAAWSETAIADFHCCQPGSVACPTVSLCLLAAGDGNVITSTDPTGGSSTWVTANIDGGTNGLDRITCASASLCVAADSVGNVFTSTNPRGGSANFWSAAAHIDATNAILGTSCPSTLPAFCLMSDGAGTIFSSTDPTGGAAAWTAQASGATYLLGASCPAAALCVVVGTRGSAVVGSAPAGGPVVAGVAPSQGPTAGGTPVTLTGSGFSTAAGATTVAFGSMQATAVSCASTTSCTATTPAENPATVNVTATVGGVTSPGSPANSFIYVAPSPPPTVSAITPAQGPAGGGTSVTIIGTGFDPAPGKTAVTFGANPAPTVSCSSATTCVATDPPGLGPEIVIVTVAGQTSSGSQASTFKYIPPHVTSMSPTNGSTSGGTVVTLTGFNFDTAPGATEVTFGSAPAAALTCSSTICTATSPPGSGAVFVSVVEGSFHTPPTSAVNFTYVAPPVGAISCGATVARSVTFKQDLGPCPGNGLVITGSGITVNLAGHRLFGDGSSGDNRVGIELAGVTGVTVTGAAPGAPSQMGDVDGFASGVSIDGGSNNTVTALDVHDNVGPAAATSNRGDGVVIGSVAASSHNTISNSVIAHNGVFDGVGVFSAQSTANQIVNSQITDNNLHATLDNGFNGMLDDGVNLGAGLEGSNGTTISGDTISRNGYNGIDACSADGTPPCLTTSNVITDNIIDTNGTTGIQSMAVNISVFVDTGNHFPPTHDVVRGNQIKDNLGVGIFVNNPYNTIDGNVVLGNSTDATAFSFGAPYDLADDTGYCTHNTWHGNTYDAGEATPACTEQGGTAVTPSSGTSAASLAPERGIAPPTFHRGSALK